MKKILWRRRKLVTMGEAKGKCSTILNSLSKFELHLQCRRNQEVLEAQFLPIAPVENSWFHGESGITVEKSDWVRQGVPTLRFRQTWMFEMSKIRWWAWGTLSEFRRDCACGIVVAHTFCLVQMKWVWSISKEIDLI